MKAHKEFFDNDEEAGFVDKTGLKWFSVNVWLSRSGDDKNAPFTLNKTPPQQETEMKMEGLTAGEALDAFINNQEVVGCHNNRVDGSWDVDGLIENAPFSIKPKPKTKTIKILGYLDPTTGRTFTELKDTTDVGSGWVRDPESDREIEVKDD